MEKEKRRNLFLLSENGRVFSERATGMLLDILFGKSSFTGFSCYGGSALESVPNVLNLLDSDAVVVIMTHHTNEWVFKVFFGEKEITDFRKIVGKTNGTHQDLYRKARAYYNGLPYGDNVFEKHVPIV